MADTPKLKTLFVLDNLLLSKNKTILTIKQIFDNILEL